MADDKKPQVVLPQEGFQESLGVLRSGIELLSEQAQVVESPPGRVDDVEVVGQLSAVGTRLFRLLRQVVELHPLPDDKKPRSGARGGASGALQSPTVAGMLAEIRTVLDGIEDRLARALPRRSSGRHKYKFQGKQKMRPQDGNAIRADFQRLGKEATYKKWCLDPSRVKRGGVVGGRGSYTVQQVAAALAWDSGGHRRQRKS